MRVEEARRDACGGAGIAEMFLWRDGDSANYATAADVIDWDALLQPSQVEKCRRGGGGGGGGGGRRPAIVCRVFRRRIGEEKEGGA